MIKIDIKDSLDSINKELEKVVSRREQLLKESRNLISMSSRSIVGTHTEKVDESAMNLKEAKKMLVKLKKIADKDLKYYLIPAETEYVEAAIVKSLSSRRPIPNQEKLGVSKESYLLGLLDAIGEMKRMVYDNIRKDRLERAVEIFELMEVLYIQLSPYAIYDNIVQGFRRKLDVSRRLIEDTRATITEEYRRGDFIKSMNNLSNKLSPKN